jgi:glyoxylase-like metal-dependent hydrolase (beta-lactamase superfamily II)
VTNPPLRFPQPTPPAAGDASAVAPGVHWLRMPLPFALDHINLWLLEDGEGWTAVDTGIALDPVKAAWERILVGKRLDRQIVTHFHPDHLGLAAWLEERTGAPLWITQGEYLTAHVIHAQIGGYSVAAMLAFFRTHGLDATRLQALEKRGNAYALGVPVIPLTYRRIYDGEEIAIGGNAWRTIVGHGHAPEHASLYCESLGVLIAGDMLLPRISTNVSAFAGVPEGNPLARFLESIDHLRSLPEDTLVLPSHDLPFYGLHARVGQLEAHHRSRCDALLGACAETPKTAAELLPVLFERDITDPHQTMFALGEAIAHLIFLEQARAMTRVVENGTIRYLKN